MTVPACFTWLPLPDLPYIPDHFVTRAKQLIASNKDNPFVHDRFSTKGYITMDKRRRKIIKNNKEHNPLFQVSYDLGEDWVQWVKENITSTFYETSVRTTAVYDYPDTETPITFGPHTDGAKFKLYYLIDRGSEETTTPFYVEPGRPMVQDLNSEFDIKFANNVDQLVEIERAKFPLNTWILLNGHVLHAVDNGTVGKRINFSITFPTENIVHSIRFIK